MDADKVRGLVRRLIARVREYYNVETEGRSLARELADACESLLSERDQLRARVAELEAELEPFTVDGYYVDIRNCERIAELLAKKD